MAVLPILHYPDPRLHTVAKPVAEINQKIKQLVSDMAQTMYEAPGIGLAATQVNAHVQVIVIDLSDERNQLQVFINPEITWASEEKKVWQEGCLSVPDFYDEVLRPSEVKVRALDIDGKSFEIHADGLMAVCIQHEMDHLKGKVFVEYLSSLKRMRIAGKLKKKSKAGEI
ncbi:MAG: peptide deformylase [Polynucleobacter victoriensis]|jgi:peptide deformylase|uniref:Peptide deformylase n=1 Tax=Polynucleobacter victoriensis TaxID=2049319 RepID=A0A212TCA8_9BURK|nr:peptide deformylase [Polynucleobacter victoriensis]SNC63678.1 peptide deformylase [Polynucleobacter victoriensis]